MNTFVLIGTIISFDTFLVTIEFQTNPPVNGGASLAVMPVEAIPCDVEVGSKVYVVKHENIDVPTISCERREE